MKDSEKNGQPLRGGDVVVVRPPAEILASLDSSGSLDAMPFMPEMLQYVGRRFTVAEHVHKICDTTGVGGSRRMRDTVFLEDLRCDGSAHGCCQAECRIYWKEAWLTRVDTATADDPSAEPARRSLEQLALANARPAVTAEAGTELYRCQATEASRATESIASPASPGQYVREITSGNVSPAQFLRVAWRAVAWKIGSRLGLNVGSRMRVPGVRPRQRPQTAPSLGLRPGDWVEVKSAKEIGGTLNAQDRNRGLLFSAPEMLPACGRRFRVRRRIDTLVDEHSGRLLKIKNDCVALEGFVCRGDRSPGRWLCSRNVYPYWREAWLRRVDPPHGDVAAQGVVPKACAHARHEETNEKEEVSAA